MRPILNETATCVITDYGSIPWDSENGRPLDHEAEAGRLYAKALADNDMTEPDAYVAPPPAPVVLRPELYSIANLEVVDGEITGFDIGTGLAGGFVLGEGQYLLFMTDTLADTTYQVRAWDDTGAIRACIPREDRYPDSFIVTCLDPANQPIDAKFLNVQIYRVV